MLQGSELPEKAMVLWVVEGFGDGHSEGSADLSKFTMTDRPVEMGACEAQIEAQTDESFHVLHGDGGGVCSWFLCLDLVPGSFADRPGSF